jgi:hypothetical protein
MFHTSPSVYTRPLKICLKHGPIQAQRIMEDGNEAHLCNRARDYVPFGGETPLD